MARKKFPAQLKQRLTENAVPFFKSYFRSCVYSNEKDKIQKQKVQKFIVLKLKPNENRRHVPSGSNANIGRRFMRVRNAADAFTRQKSKYNKFSKMMLRKYDSSTTMSITKFKRKKIRNTVHSIEWRKTAKNIVRYVLDPANKSDSL